MPKERRLELFSGGALKDYYGLLGLKPGASSREIRRAYKMSVRKWHPDLHPDDPASSTKVQEINDAYEVLSDPDKRSAYDRRNEEERNSEAQKMGSPSDQQKTPFLSYFLKMNEGLRKRTQK